MPAAWCGTPGLVRGSIAGGTWGKKTPQGQGSGGVRAPASESLSHRRHRTANAKPSPRPKCSRYLILSFPSPFTHPSKKAKRLETSFKMPPVSASLYGTREPFTNALADVCSYSDTKPSRPRRRRRPAKRSSLFSASYARRATPE